MLKNRKVNITFTSRISNKIKKLKKSRKNIIQHKVLGNDSSLNLLN